MVEGIENRYGTLHGGCIATIVDVVSTAALLTLSSESGVSQDLNVTYLNSCKHNEEVLVDARALKVGKTTAVLSVDIRSATTGRLLAQGRHTKHTPGTELPAGMLSKL